MQAFFLSAASGQRFCLLHEPPPGTRERGRIVFAPPFAEEMNCARRTVACQARALATAGYAVLQIDFFGCGDSSGDFADARWSDWQADLHLACDTLRTRGDSPLWLWGLRAGALLAAQVAAERPEQPALLLWQAQDSGEAVLRQMLRLKLASQANAGQSGQGKALRQQLLGGKSLDIAGYRLSPGLAADLEGAHWPATLAPRRIEYCDFSSSGKELSPAAESLCTAWQHAGHRLATHAIASPAFWQTPGLQAPAALYPQVCQALSETTA